MSYLKDKSHALYVRKRRSWSAFCNLNCNALLEGLRRSGNYNNACKYNILLHFDNDIRQNNTNAF